MSLLTEREWNVGYRNEDGDLIALFYNPALECALQYHHLTGYFSADSLALAARGIEALIANDGRCQRRLPYVQIVHQNQPRIGRD